MVFRYSLLRGRHRAVLIGKAVPLARSGSLGVVLPQEPAPGFLPQEGGPEEQLGAEQHGVKLIDLKELMGGGGGHAGQLGAQLLHPLQGSLQPVLTAVEGVAQRLHHLLNLPQEVHGRHGSPGGERRSIITTEGRRTASKSINLEAGETLDLQHVGMMREATVEGMAFLDANYNGLYDAGEAPLAGVDVEIYKSNGDLVGSALSAEDGSFRLTALRPNDYRLRVILPDDGSTFTTTVDASVTGNWLKARSGRRENSVDPLTLALGENKQVVVGAIYPGSITGTCYLDDNFSATMDEGEKVVSGLTVTLLDAEGNAAAYMNVEEVRDAAGKASLYNRIDIAPYGDGGQYIVTVTLDKAFLTAPDTVYPVAAATTSQETIGSAYINDADVNSGSPSTNYGSSSTLWVGYINGAKYRSYVQFCIEPYESYIAPYGISDAYLLLYEKSGNTSTFTMQPRIPNNIWTYTSLTWNNQPGYWSTFNGVSAPSNVPL